jgi:FkbM family methyltransferase
MLLLPTRFKSNILREKYAEYVIKETTVAAKKHIRQFIQSDGSVNIYGHPFYPAYGNFGELIEFFHQVFISDQYNAANYLKDGAVIIDAGANIGSFSVFSSHIKKNVTVYAFEPTKGTFDVLKKNTAAYKNIFCYNLGLGEEATTKKIFFSTHSTGGSAFEDRGIVESHTSSDLSQMADIITIDAFVKQNNISRVDFIKIDTEGYEAKILNGARETIARFHPVMAMSAYHKAEDRTVLPQIVKSIYADYDYELTHADEEDLIFYPKK